MNYSYEELKEMLGYVGEHVQIHRSVAFFNPKDIFINSYVRIDCFCMISAGSDGVHIGKHVHLAPATHLFGGGGRIFFDDFSGISSRVSFFTSSDDYSEGHIANASISCAFRKVTNGSIILHRHALIGCNSVILPGVEIGFGGSIGALSLVKKSVEECALVAGIPAKKIGERNRAKLLEMEEKFLENLSFAKKH
jgi:galactoside O-acetyltransferase